LKTVVPFRAWRYAPQAGEPAQLLAPPYDVIGPELQSRLYARSPYNVVRVDLGMTMPSDTDCDNRYTRAATQLAEWKKTGVLVRDPDPSVTFVEETFTGPDGQAAVRHGFLAAMRLHRFDEGVVFPHEHTLSAPKEDRFRLMTATAMSLSPVFLLYDLPGDDITAARHATLADRPAAVSVTDERGTVTRLWPTSDPALLEVIRRNLETSRFVIADGHHRYETALRYEGHRSEATSRESTGNRERSLAKAGYEERDESQSYHYALAYFGNMSDPGLAIYPTHRLLKDLPPEKVASLPKSLADTFSVERLDATGSAAVGPQAGGSANGAAAYSAMAAYLREHPRGTFGLWGPTLDGMYGIRLRDAEAVRRVAPSRSTAYRGLDVTILQTLILEGLFGITPQDMAEQKYVTFFGDPYEAVARLEAQEFQLGFFMNPTGLDQVRDVAFGGERMPQKATFFYPKLPTGLVFHDLNGPL